MEHKGTGRLETERLILRKFAESDIESSYRVMIRQQNI